MTDILFTPIRLSELEILIQNSVTKALKENRLSANYEPSSNNRLLVFGMKVCRELTGFSASAIYQRTSKGLIPHFRRDGKLLFRRDEIMIWLTENRIMTQDEFSKTLDSKLTNKKSRI